MFFSMCQLTKCLCTIVPPAHSVERFLKISLFPQLLRLKVVWYVVRHLAYSISSDNNLALFRLCKWKLCQIIKKCQIFCEECSNECTIKDTINFGEEDPNFDNKRFMTSSDLESFFSNISLDVKRILYFDFLVQHLTIPQSY